MPPSEDLLIDTNPQCVGPRARSANDVASADWDEDVRHAFFGGCLGHEIRAEIARRELVRTTKAARVRELGAAFAQSTEQAREGWSTIDRCLAIHGELAALALERCVEETSLQLRRPSGVFASSALQPRRAPSLVAENEQVARSVVDRARERLVWFRAGRIGA